jgi:hypothetical protein
VALLLIGVVAAAFFYWPKWPFHRR